MEESRSFNAKFAQSYFCAPGGRAYFFFHSAMNMPLALYSWGQRVS